MTYLPKCSHLTLRVVPKTMPVWGTIAVVEATCLYNVLLMSLKFCPMVMAIHRTSKPFSGIWHDMIIGNAYIEIMANRFYDCTFKGKVPLKTIKATRSIYSI